MVGKEPQDQPSNYTRVFRIQCVGARRCSNLSWTRNVWWAGNYKFLTTWTVVVGDGSTIKHTKTNIA